MLDKNREISPLELMPQTAAALAGSDLNELDVVGDGSERWRVVEIAGGVAVAALLEYFRVVEVCEDGQQTAAVPVVGDATPVVAFARQVHDGVERHRLVLVNEHLTSSSSSSSLSATSSSTNRLLHGRPILCVVVVYR